MPMEIEKKNLETILCEAVEISSAEEREAYLNRVCGEDNALRSKAERLISDHFEAKREALRAYASQFHNPGYTAESTFIASKEFWEGIEVRARYLGGFIGKAYGEGLYSDGPAPVDPIPGL